ncbi:MAG: pyruvate dehydrogenase (acetyl-transferring), homodimeric type [Candidatus Latescibacteria bacterium]|nr:pyruvate dehydrogenase (acetyl-transferring), homodimeric type [Candidatus Latescibacterota bacterium]
MSDKVLRKPAVDADPAETQEWLESLDYALQRHGPDRVRFLLDRLQERARRQNVEMPFSANTPYVNTIPVERQPPYPGDREIERRIKSFIRWNAMAMVIRANREEAGIGGHISTYASAATLFEMGFNHFFRGKGEDFSGDQVYFQGHASPGVYARAFVEGRLGVEQLENFRRELKPSGGLSSYPHPWLMPNFWEFPTVSMGLSPIMSIYQARFNRYLEDRGIKDTSGSHIWVFMGDGETDEPEALGAITLAAREKLDNLIFVINCNLQRLDGPVRGNGKIIQELEAAFRGAGWNVIKVIWGEDWDPLLAKDEEGLLVQRMGEVVDGQYQKYVVESGAYTRKDFFGVHPRLLQMVEHLSDEEIRKLRRGGHDPEKVYAAYRAAVEHEGAPTVVLAQTIKGYGLGEHGEGRNVSHQQKKLNEDELREFRTRFGIPISDDEVAQAPFYRPPGESREVQYMKRRREELGGFVPSRERRAGQLKAPATETFEEFLKGTGDKDLATTAAFVRLLSKLLRDPDIGRMIVPIIPDEARTFGMEPLFRQCGIYSHVGQLYEPVDRDTLLYYREARDGQILEEGITEAGAMSSFIAAGTAYATHGVNTIPFFIFYSMFGFQRIGDLIWAAADMRCKGFLLGGTSGRTTLNGEGLQHEDGHSHLLACSVPNLITYDPAFAYEIAVIVQEGIRRMYEAQEDIFYYITLGNEPYPMPPIPEGAQEGILKGLYKFKVGEQRQGWPRVHLFGSGAILREALRAQTILAGQFGVSADVWSATSYKELRRDALAVERWNMLHPTKRPRKPYVTKLLEKEEGPVVAASDYMKALPDMIAPWTPGGLQALGTDGFGRSDSRAALRRHFEVDAESIAVAALYALLRQGKVKKERVEEAIRALGVDPEKPDPVTA